jgi:hypothetical protein
MFGSLWANVFYWLLFRNFKPKVCGFGTASYGKFMGTPDVSQGKGQTFTGF